MAASNESRIIKVVVHCAKGLLAADFNGYSDPYVLVEAISSGADHAHATREVFRTQTIKKCLNPVWGESSKLSLNRSETKLRFTVFDWDNLSSDDYLGEAVVDLAEVFQESPSPYLVLHLTAGPQAPKVKVTGSLTVALTDLIGISSFASLPGGKLPKSATLPTPPGGSRACPDRSSFDTEPASRSKARNCSLPVAVPSKLPILSPPIIVTSPSGTMNPLIATLASDAEWARARTKIAKLAKPQPLRLVCCGRDCADERILNGKDDLSTETERFLCMVSLKPLTSGNPEVAPKQGEWIIFCEECADSQDQVPPEGVWRWTSLKELGEEMDNLYPMQALERTIETQKQIIAKLKAENQALRDEVRTLRGGSSSRPH